MTIAAALAGLATWPWAGRDRAAVARAGRTAAAVAAVAHRGTPVRDGSVTFVSLTALRPDRESPAKRQCGHPGSAQRRLPKVGTTAAQWLRVAEARHQAVNLDERMLGELAPGNPPPRCSSSNCPATRPSPISGTRGPVLSGTPVDVAEQWLPPTEPRSPRSDPSQPRGEMRAHRCPIAAISWAEQRPDTCREPLPALTSWPCRCAAPRQ